MARVKDMKLSELVEALQELQGQYGGNLSVVLSKNSEGTSARPLGEATVLGYEPRNTWSGDIVDGVDTVILWPVENTEG